MADRKPGEGCKGCFYRRSLGGEAYACFYSVVEDELRGCPPGEGCICYKDKNFFLKKRKATNCPNCGAPIRKGKFKCEYCGTEV